ncbi:discoidin domain-containing protein [Agaribacter flavus]|uniref:Discoidin domain-containing protein n=1 Tax=Agaribacter flavus TaxID=1902781 RepID=A0ABV7FP48_9ALTE
MKKLAVLFALSACFCVNANPYESIANAINIDSDGLVQIELLALDDDSAECIDTGLYFNLNSAASEVWLDTIILSRQSNQLLNFTFEESSCELTQLGLPQIYTDSENTPSLGPLTETGLYGNVALIGTNGIDETSITSNSHYKRDVAAAAFDGYLYTQKTNDDAGDRVARGIWLAPLEEDEADLDLSPTITVDFQLAVELKGIGIFINQQSLSLGRLPRQMAISVSQDGQNFEPLVVHNLQNKEDNMFELPQNTKFRYFKMQFIQNFGDAKFVEVDEIEFYQ